MQLQRINLNFNTENNNYQQCNKKAESLTIFAETPIFY